jgi:hypothetical protein
VKRRVLFAVAVLFGFSFHPLIAATNLVQNGNFENGTADWPLVEGPFTIIAANGPSASGTASALLGGQSTSAESQIGQHITTVPGINYVVEFDYKTLDSDTADDESCVVEVVDANNNVLSEIYRHQGNGQPTTAFQTAAGTFTATGTAATIFVVGSDESVIDNVVVTSGSFSEPGKYTGSVKISGTIPLESVGSFHTESVVARVTPTGALYLIEQPSGTVEAGDFESDNTLAISGTTAPVTFKGRTDITFTVTNDTVTEDQNEIPVTDLETFSLRKVGK